MMRWAVPVVLLALLLGGAFFFQQQQSRERAGFPAPDFALKDLRGQTYRLSDFNGKIVFLNLWTTWCPPCREEMPAMERLHRRMRGQDFVMLAVSQDEKGREAVEPFVREIGITFPVILDPEATLSRRFGVTGYPETFIIDRTGQVIRHIIGPEAWESDEAYSYFAGLVQRGAAELGGQGLDATTGG